MNRKLPNGQEKGINDDRKLTSCLLVSITVSITSPHFSPSPRPPLSSSLPNLTLSHPPTPGNAMEGAAGDVVIAAGTSGAGRGGGLVLTAGASQQSSGGGITMMTGECGVTCIVYCVLCDVM
jgi:hypothetical protein